TIRRTSTITVRITAIMIRRTSRRVERRTTRMATKRSIKTRSWTIKLDRGPLKDPSRDQIKSFANTQLLGSQLDDSIINLAQNLRRSLTNHIRNHIRGLPPNRLKNQTGNQLEVEHRSLLKV